MDLVLTLTSYLTAFRSAVILIRYKKIFESSPPESRYER
jgi:hypothetical protein